MKLAAGQSLTQHHSGAQLEIRRLRVKKLLRQGSGGAESDSQSSGNLLAQDHSGVLKEMLGEDVLSLSESSRPFQGSKGDKGLEEALAETAGSVPAPKIRIFSGRNREPLGSQTLEASVGQFKSGDLRAMARRHRKARH